MFAEANLHMEMCDKIRYEKTASSVKWRFEVGRLISRSAFLPAGRVLTVVVNPICWHTVMKGDFHRLSRRSKQR